MPQKSKPCLPKYPPWSKHVYFCIATPWGIFWGHILLGIFQNMHNYHSIFHLVLWYLVLWYLIVGTLVFGTLVFGIWYFGIWYFGIWYFGTLVFGTWYFGIWYFGIWYFGIWYFGIWYFGTWYFGIWYFGSPVGSLWAIFWSLLQIGRHFPGQVLSSTAPGDRIKPPGILHRIPPLPGSSVRNRCSDPTSTRAGGQDDVS